MSLYNRVTDYQKLQLAWSRVFKNKPAPGVDNITYEQFDADKKLLLRELSNELRHHEYEALPVRTVVLYRGEKARTIALYCMRDKVVQQALAAELNLMYDNSFSGQTYAYRNGKSALVALDEIAEAVKNMEYTHYLKLDIEKFFDNISWLKLKSILKKQIDAEDVLELIRQNSCSKELDTITGELTEKKKGIYQGSGLAPVLSNIYLLDFDRTLVEEDIFFIRYSDDIIILGKSENMLQELARKISSMLGTLSLKISDGKSSCGMIENGFDFLGLHFDRTGKSITAKAEAGVQEKLELMWLTHTDISFEEKIKKSVEIMNGWEQYFRCERPIGSMIEWVSTIFMSGRRQLEDAVRDSRLNFQNVFRDVCQYLTGYWKINGDMARELYEYEDYYLGDVERTRLCENINEELLNIYRSYFILESIDGATELMQCYTDMHEYNKAQFWSEKRQFLENSQKVWADNVSVVSGRKIGEDLQISGSSVGKILKLFAGREDICARDIIETGGKRSVQMQAQPVTEELIKKHISGDVTLSTYVQRPNSTVKYMVVDVDISKKVIIQYGNAGPEFKAFLEKALAMAIEILKLIQQMGIRGYIEFSGYRGYHVWIFFTEWIQVRYAIILSEILESKISPNENINIEFFPNKTRVKEGKYGQCIKIPFGYHAKSCERSYFFDESMHPVMDIDAFLDGVAKTSLGAIKKVIAVNTGNVAEKSLTSVDENLNVFGNIPDTIREVLLGCNLMRYLCQKSVKTGYLSHFERLSVLYVFGHVGDDGKKFVHTVMSFTLNYQYNVTEKFIRKLPDKPVSCIKLRDQYKKVTAEYGCSCVFKRTKNCYPSPVLHAIVSSGDAETDVTVPTSRTLTKEKEKQVVESMNNCSMAENIAGQIQTKKKQRRGLDKEIRKLENELSEIFDNAGIDSLELKVGVLIRRKAAEGYEWVIEL